MVSTKKLIKISTKRGDQGQSGLISGRRERKSAPVFVAIGDLDELNSWLGLVVVQFGQEFQQYRDFLYQIQDTLFYLGAELAHSPRTKLTESQVEALERHSDQLQTELAADWHSKFLLPGGTALGAHLDIARTICRRAERAVVALAEVTTVRPVVFRYLNRLSDYLYILRCFVNHTLEYQERKFVPEYGQTA